MELLFRKNNQDSAISQRLGTSLPARLRLTRTDIGTVKLDVETDAGVQNLQFNVGETALTDSITTEWVVEKDPVASWTLRASNTLNQPTTQVQGRFYFLRVVPQVYTPVFNAIYDFGSIVQDWSQDRYITFYFDGTVMKVVGYV